MHCGRQDALRGCLCDGTRTGIADSGSIDEERDAGIEFGDGRDGRGLHPDADRLIGRRVGDECKRDRDRRDAEGDSTGAS